MWFYLQQTDKQNTFINLEADTVPLPKTIQTTKNSAIKRRGEPVFLCGDIMT